METDNKSLRPVVSEDEEALQRLFRLPEVYEYLADGVEPPPSVAADWIGAAAESGRCGGGLWALTERRQERLLGVVRLSGESELELTYLLHPGVWGAGYATRMAHTVMSIAFESGLVSAIWAGSDVPNVASIAVMKRLGMRFRRSVEYPAGAGVEYVIDAASFDPARSDCLPMV